MEGFVWLLTISNPPRHKSQCFLRHCSQMEKSRWLTESRKVNFYQESKDGTSQPKFLAPRPWLNHCHSMPKSTLSLLRPQRSAAGHSSLVYAHGPCLCLFASISLWHLCLPAPLNVWEALRPPPLLLHPGSRLHFRFRLQQTRNIDSGGGKKVQGWLNKLKPSSWLCVVLILIQNEASLQYQRYFVPQWWTNGALLMFLSWKDLYNIVNHLPSCIW